MKKTLFLFLAFILLVSFPIDAQSNKVPVEIIEHFKSDGEETLAKLFTYEIKESIRDSNILEISNGSSRRVALLITTLPHSDFSNNTFIFSVSWLMFDPSSDAPPYFLDSTLGYTSKDVYKESARNIFITTEDLFRDIM